MFFHRFESTADFWQQAQADLLQHRAENNLLLSLVHNLMQRSDRGSEPPYLAMVTPEATGIAGKILAAALRTPPHKLVLAKAQDLAAIQLIAQDLQKASISLPGVSGLVPEVETFLQAWQALTGQAYYRAMAMRIHELTQVAPLPPVRGCLRPATETDRPLLLEWFAAFAREIGEVVSQQASQAVDTGLQDQSIYLWEDGVPVSWANRHLFSPAAARIGPVYTPTEYRGQGYATACVAALSQKLLDQGCNACFIFTDLTNPTSNHIYRKIGYQPICDWHDYSFKPLEFP